MRNENFYRDTIRPFSFENVVEDFKWLEGPTGSEIIDNFNNEYTYEYIFDLWVKEKNPSKILGLPILADQYEKALSEYGKYGRLIRFPEKEIYKMVKNIIRKTIILIKVSSMSGAFKYIPYDFISKTLVPYYSDFIGTEVDLTNSGYTIEYKISIESAMKKYGIKSVEDIMAVRKLEKAMREEYGDYYFPINSQKKSINYVADKKNIYSSVNEIQQSVEFWNKLFPDKICNDYPIIKISFNKDDTITIKATTIFASFEIGFVDDFKNIITEQMGLSYVFFYLKQFRDDMSPEEMLVWLNEIMHAYHLRSDISELFISGGAYTLNKIENGVLH